MKKKLEINEACKAGGVYVRRVNIVSIRDFTDVSDLLIPTVVT